MGSIDEISEAIGRLGASVEDATRQNQRLERMLQTGLESLERSMKEMLRELRDRYHEHHNKIQTELNTMGADYLKLRDRVQGLEDRAKEQKILTRANIKWISGISSFISSAIIAAIEIFIHLHGAR